MLSSLSSPHFELFKSRRNLLHSIIRESEFSTKNALVILFGDFENERSVFRQESSFYYLTGISEPAVALFSFCSGKDVLYMPQYATKREQWLNTCLSPSLESARDLSVSEIKYLGDTCKGYSFSPIFSDREYRNIIKDLSDALNSDMDIFTIFDYSSPRYLSQLQCCHYLFSIYPDLKSKVRDISGTIHHMRRMKDNFEIGQIYKAVQITSTAHEVVAGSIASGIFENQLQAQIEHVFTSMHATTAFPSIVATGKNSTVLHYTDRNKELKDGDVVVVDIGAEYGGYAADITRTYPVNGKFSPRQKEIYEIVLETQGLIEAYAKPGMFLRNNSQPDISLHHLAVSFLEKKGYAKYFPHGIGHFLGLDVHDVGDYSIPLNVGDVITIEPGIYIPEEKLGIRIEDDYVIVDDGCVCLSSELPRTVPEIEALMEKSQSTYY